MIEVNITSISSKISKFSKSLNSFILNYNNYYNKIEDTSNYWVGMVATKFFDTQLINKTINRKLINNIEVYKDIMNFVVENYSLVASKNIKIELTKQSIIEEKYRKIDSELKLAYEVLENISKYRINTIQIKLETICNRLKNSSDKTIHLFEKVSDYESKINDRINELVISKVNELEIDSYMIN